MSDAPALAGGIATGIGSMPGTDPLASARLIFDEVALPYVPELPARGAGADLVGRAAALLVDIRLETSRAGYRLAGGRTLLTSRADGFLRADLDAVEEVVERGGYSSPIKLAAVGPFTFAALVELPSGHKVLHDPGAVRDVVGSLAEGLAQRADDLARRTGREIVVQLDEPMVGPVIDGHIAPLTRLDVNPPIPAPDVAAALSQIADRIGRPMVLHSCAAPRWDLFEKLSGWALSLDVAEVGVGEYEHLGVFLDGGGRLIAGVVPSTRPAAPVSADQVAARLLAATDRIGLPRTMIRDQVLISPTCGLAGAGDWAPRALALSTTIADQVRATD